MTEFELYSVGGTALLATVFALFWATYNFLRIDKSKVRTHVGGGVQSMHTELNVLTQDVYST